MNYKMSMGYKMGYKKSRDDMAGNGIYCYVIFLLEKMKRMTDCVMEICYNKNKVDEMKCRYLKG